MLRSGAAFRARQWLHPGPSRTTAPTAKPKKTDNDDDQKAGPPERVAPPRLTSSGVDVTSCVNRNSEETLCQEHCQGHQQRPHRPLRTIELLTAMVNGQWMQPVPGPAPGLTDEVG